MLSRYHALSILHIGNHGNVLKYTEIFPSCLLIFPFPLSFRYFSVTFSLFSVAFSVTFTFIFRVFRCLTLTVLLPCR